MLHPSSGNSLDSGDCSNGHEFHGFLCAGRFFPISWGMEALVWWWWGPAVTGNVSVCSFLVPGCHRACYPLYPQCLGTVLEQLCQFTLLRSLGLMHVWGCGAEDWGSSPTKPHLGICSFLLQHVKFHISKSCKDSYSTADLQHVTPETLILVGMERGPRNLHLMNSPCVFAFHSFFFFGGTGN